MITKLAKNPSILLIGAYPDKNGQKRTSVQWYKLLHFCLLSKWQWCIPDALESHDCYIQLPWQKSTDVTLSNSVYEMLIFSANVESYQRKLVELDEKELKSKEYLK